MLKQIKNLIQTNRHGFSKPQPLELTADEVRAARDYVKHYWPKLRRFHTSDEGSLVGLPKPYLIPSQSLGQEFDFNELYYWDSYFMAQGLLDKQNKELVMGILEDLAGLFKRFEMIPNGSRTYLTGRSQPPLLTSFIFDVYNTYKPGLDWLQAMMDVAEAEYKTVWMGKTKPNDRQVYRKLSRYYDINLMHGLAEVESGWDYTPRFYRDCLSFLPIDLNSLLYKYEVDLALAAQMLGRKAGARGWEKAAEARRRTINELMWDDSAGFYFDFNYVKQQPGGIKSLAAFYPLWAGLASKEQAKALTKHLSWFEHSGGLATTERLPSANRVDQELPQQWAYPNGWAPLHFIVVKGLQRYGYHDDARRIAHKWLRTNLDWFNTHKVFTEKYNVVHPGQPPAAGVYPMQDGFGWTNAIFERFCQEFIGPNKS